MKIYIYWVCDSGSSHKEYDVKSLVLDPCRCGDNYFFKLDNNSCDTFANPNIPEHIYHYSTVFASFKKLSYRKINQLKFFHISCQKP